MSINIILYKAVFQQIYLQFCSDSYTFIIYYSGLTLYKCSRPFVLPFQCFTFMDVVILVLIPFPITSRYNVISEASTKSSPKNVSMSLNSVCILAVLPTILLTNIHLYSSAYLVLTLKGLCSFVLLLWSFSFMDVVIIVLL